MQKTIIIYHSKTGLTKRYANWLQEALSCEAIPFKQRSTISLADFDTVLYGGSLHAGMIRGIKWFKGQLPSLSGKKLCVFVTGATPADSPDVPKTLRRNFSDEEWEAVRVFYMQSGLCYEKMGIVDKLMMAIFRGFVKKQEGESSAMYQAIRQSYDSTAKDAILPIVEYCKS